MVGVVGGDRVDRAHDLFDRIAAGAELDELGSDGGAQPTKPPPSQRRVLAQQLEDCEMRSYGSRVPEGSQRRGVQRSDRDDGVERRSARQ